MLASIARRTRIFCRSFRTNLEIKRHPSTVPCCSANRFVFSFTMFQQFRTMKLSEPRCYRLLSRLTPSYWSGSARNIITRKPRIRKYNIILDMPCVQRNSVCYHSNTRYAYKQLLIVWSFKFSTRIILLSLKINSSFNSLFKFTSIIE